MKVKIKDFGLDLDVKNRGVSLDIYGPNGGKHMGDLKVTKTGLTWCNGKAHSGPKATWEEFIEWMNS